MSSMKLRKTSRGFTLVELLVVVLILAVLMAVALPLYLSAIQDSEKKTARANMQTIANAEQAYKVRLATHVYTSTLSDLKADLGKDFSLANAGPGDRTYVVTLGAGTCTDAAGSTVTVPADGFQVTTSSATATVVDGCFVPGVTAQ